MTSTTFLSRLFGLWLPMFVAAVVQAEESGTFVADLTTGCKVWTGATDAGLEVRWSGKCSDGRAEGPGTAEWKASGKWLYTVRSVRRNGRSEGPFTSTSSEGREFEANARAGVISGFGTMSLPPQHQSVALLRARDLGHTEGGKFVVRGWWLDGDLVVECPDKAACQSLNAVQIVENEPRAGSLQPSNLSKVGEALVANMPHPWPRAEELASPCTLRASADLERDGSYERLSAKLGYIAAVSLWGQQWFPSHRTKAANGEQCTDLPFLVRQFQRAIARPETGIWSAQDVERLIKFVDPALTGLISTKALDESYGRPLPGSSQTAIAAARSDQSSTGVASLTQRAERGEAAAQDELGMRLVKGRGVAKDEVAAARWFRKAADQGNASAQNNLGLMLEQGRGVAKDEAQAVQWYRKAADQGDASAQDNLGRMFEGGHGVAKDEAQAVQWYRKAAEQGLSTAQLSVGRMLITGGEGVPMNEIAGADWIRKAANQELSPAQYLLGNLYGNGDGVPQNNAAAANWFRRAADSDYAPAQYALGRLYWLGVGVPKNEAQAASWIRKAAENGFSKAQDTYGWDLLHANKGLQKNELMGVNFLQKAVAQNNYTAMAHMGFVWKEGLAGYRIDCDEALRWFKRAAAGGDAVGQFGMGQAYDDSCGVRGDRAQAVSWWRLAAEQGNSAAKSALNAVEHLEAIERLESSRRPPERK